MSPPTRTSPIIGLRLASLPGGGVFHALAEAALRAFKRVLISLIALGLVSGFTLGLILSPLIGHSRVVIGTGLLVSVAVLLFLYWTARRVKAQIPSLILGLQGERVVAACLAELGASGYIVLHNPSVPSPEGVPVGNIDHVLIGPAGVFCVETKVRSKRPGVKPSITADGDRILVDGRASQDDPASQVSAAARRVSHRLAAAGIQVSVGAVVLFPGRYVTRTRPSDVFIANPKEVFGYLRDRPAVLSPQVVKACYQAMVPWASAAADDANDD